MLISKVSYQSKFGDILFVTLENNNGYKLVLCSYGASIYQIIHRHSDDTVQLLNLTNENIEEFLTSPSYYGKTVGRVSGRLFGPSYQIFDEEYQVNLIAEESSMLHGGPNGFSFQNFNLVNQDITDDAAKITFFYESSDGEEGFPGNVGLYVSYELNNEDQVVIDYYATSDQDTILNITNHTYFNLSPQFESIETHQLTINSNQYIEVDGDFRFKAVQNVENTLFDFRVSKAPLELSNALKNTLQKGIDHTFLITDGSNIVAKLEHKNSEIGLDVYSTYPSVVIYTHQYPSKKKLIGIEDDGAYRGITFECLFEPDGIHHPELHSSILKKNIPYQESIVFQFYRKEK
ncbi:MAG: aldose epimerase family protein [Acholeplasmataceae bacterium]|nr:aldose epimerase family protein [Acholeplasmataceae bacterium]